ncbi:MFS transporter [uncultured Methanoregula sp.]|uniref:MFS transporter n=1 Tax=uncultured Methanoregula sp. TaxID=1005933 RepID=UPI003748AA33
MPGHVTRSGFPAKENVQYLVILTISLGAFLAAFDASAVNLATTLFIREFGTDFSTVSLITTIYEIVMTVFLIIFGKVADLQGLKKTYLQGLGLFIASSFLCGLSWGILPFIIFRVFQATGAAMIFASAPALMTTVLPESVHGKALAWLSVITSVGFCLGWGIGGLIIHLIGWKWVFLSNVPIGIAVILLGKKILSEPVRHTTRDPFDYRGAIIVAFFIGVFLLGLSVIEIPGMSDLVLGLIFFIAIIAAVICYGHLKKCPFPVIDINLLKKPGYSIALAVSTIVTCLTVSVSFLFPLYLHEFEHVDYFHSGLILMGSSVFSMIISPFVGGFADRHGSRRVCIWGLLLILVSMLLFSVIPIASGFLVMSAVLCLFRIAGGAINGPLDKVILNHCPVESRGSGSGIMMTVRHSTRVIAIVFVEIFFGASIFSAGISSTGETLISETNLSLFSDGFQIFFIICSCLAVVALILSLSIRERSYVKPV